MIESSSVAERPRVRSDEIEACLDGLRRSCRDPRAGLFGPASRIWAINREAAAFLGGGRAALLQVAHPQVAQAIAHHSRTRNDPYGRFQRTFRQVFPMVWGSLDEALAAARRVWTVHQSIHGTFDEDVGLYRRGDPYDANDRGALLWVHATLWETSIRMHEMLLAPLSEATKDAYYRETLRFAALFGLDESELPASWSSFAAWNESMWSSDELAVGAAGREIAGYLFAAKSPLLRRPLERLRDVTAALLPARLRAELGLPWGEREKERAERSLSRMRSVLRHLPARLRYVPPYFEARRRLRGRTGPGFLGALFTRMYLGRSQARDG